MRPPPAAGGGASSRSRGGAEHGSNFLPLAAPCKCSFKAPVIFVGIFGSRQHRGPLYNPLTAVALRYLFISTRAGRGQVLPTSRN